MVAHAAHAECGYLHLAIVAPPKAGSTFFGVLLKALAFHASMCRVTQLQYRCATTISIGCPGAGTRCHRHGHRRAARKTSLCSWSSTANRTFAVPSACCDSVRPLNASDLLEAPYTRGEAASPEMFRGACTAAAVQSWLSTRSRAWAADRPGLEDHGHLTGPIRVLPPINQTQDTSAKRVADKALLASLVSLAWTSRASEQAAIGRLPLALPRLAFPSVVVLMHRRHPVESLISHIFCISSARVCPRRAALLANASGSTWADEHDWGGLDTLLLRELYGSEQSSVNKLLDRMHTLANWLEQVRALQAGGLAIVRELERTEARGDNLVAVDRSRNVPCVGRERTKSSWPLRHNEVRPPVLQTPLPLVLLSRYEAMATDFDAWLEALLDSLPDGVARVASRASLHGTLVSLFKADFVVDGRHKHSLVPGSNLAKVQPATLLRLQEHHKLASVVARLGYEFQNPLAGAARQKPSGEEGAVMGAVGEGGT